MPSSVWITNTTINERIEHQQNCDEQEGDHRNNLLASLFRLEVEHLRLTRSTRAGHPCDAAENARELRMLSSRRPMAYGNGASAWVSAAPKLVAHASVLSFCSMDQSTPPWPRWEPPASPQPEPTRSPGPPHR